MKKRIQDFVLSLKTSNESVKLSNQMVRDIDPLMIRLRFFQSITSAFSIIGGAAFVGFILQKAIDGKFNLENIELFHVYSFVTLFLSFGIISLYIRARINLRIAMFDEEFDQKIDDMYVEKINNLDLGRISDPEFIELSQNARRAKWCLKEIWKSKYDVVSALLAIVTSLGILGIVDYKVIIISLIPFLPEFLKTIVVDARQRALELDHVLPERYLWEYKSCLTDTDMSVQTKLFGFTKYYYQRYLYFRNKVMRDKFDLQVFVRNADVLVGITRRICGALVVLYLGYGVVQGRLDVFKLMTIYGCATAFRSRCDSLSREVVDLSSGHERCKFHVEFMAVKPLIDQTGAEEISFSGVPSVSLDKVTFTYPGRTDKALKGCSFEIAPNSKVALIGKNGCGKTTILKMLAKVYTQDSGRVLYNGIDTKSILQKSLYRSLLYVTQETGLPDFPIDEAITGSDRKEIDYPRLMKASEIVGCHEFISELPHAYQTQIGREWPGGVGFSSGQLQRLKLVAAFYKLLDPGVKIALFDEPMSHCDVETRERFYGALGSFTDKTIVVVAHDLNCLSYFERLIVIEDGKVHDTVVGKNAIAEYRHKVERRLADEF